MNTTVVAIYAQARALLRRKGISSEVLYVGTQEYDDLKKYCDDMMHFERKGDCTEEYFGQWKLVEVKRESYLGFGL